MVERDLFGHEISDDSLDDASQDELFAALLSDEPATSVDPAAEEEAEASAGEEVPETPDTEEESAPEEEPATDADSPVEEEPAAELPEEVAEPVEKKEAAPRKKKAEAAPPAEPPEEPPTTRKRGSGGNDELRGMIDEYFLQYASYVIRDRAIPKLGDGLKPVQRRILFSLHEKDDGKFIKVANIVGYCMQYHPHGDASIADALVVLANKRYLIEGQGNFGNIYTGDRAAASRYIECRLTDLAREQLFNNELTEFVPSYDGRSKEPVCLPAKIPLLLMLGAEGIAVGLSTRVLPHNFPELLEAQIAILQKKSFQVFPDFQHGGLMDVSEYEDGNGKIKLRAKVETVDKTKLKITELAHGTTTESLIASIEDAAKKGKIKIRSIDDYTAENIEILVKLSSGQDAATAIQALYAFTDCEVSISSRIIVIDDNRPIEMSVSEVLKANTKKLVADLKRELLLNKKKLEKELHHKTLVQIFVENRIYKQIEECKTSDAIHKAIRDGFKPFEEKLTRDLTKDDVEMLLGVRIRRISLFDINKHREEMDGIVKDLAEIEKNLGQLTKYAVGYLRSLLKKYKDQYPRLTSISDGVFHKVKVEEVAVADIAIKHDAEKGYVGSDVSGEEILKCSSYDKVLVIQNDGTYRVCTPPPDKLFVDTDMAYCALVDKERVMTVVYTADQITYMKRFKVGGYIQNKEYNCAQPGAKILMFSADDPKELYVKYKPAKNQRIHQQVFNLHDIPVKGAKARGNQVTVKKIAKATTTKPRNWDGDAPAGAML